MNSWQEAYFGVGCVLCGIRQAYCIVARCRERETCQVVRESVTEGFRTWSTVIWSYKIIIIQSGWHGTRSVVWLGQLVPAVLSLLPVAIKLTAMNRLGGIFL